MVVVVSAVAAVVAAPAVAAGVAVDYIVVAVVGQCYCRHQHRYDLPPLQRKLLRPCCNDKYYDCYGHQLPTATTATATASTTLLLRLLLPLLPRLQLMPLPLQLQPTTNATATTTTPAFLLRLALP